ncbi:MAG: dihydrolipoyl dehydrogenase [Candidatus Omnitrophica bacterium]|nr:dihydrolipoyl dehydrogenase [Candidatus Omnitrophota bacterium]
MYDVCIIGSGWAGFNAAIKASQLGATVCLIEKDVIGGVCLNRGCVPTKILAKSSDLLSLFKKAPDFGIDATIEFDFIRVLQRKKNVIERLNKGMQDQLKIKNIQVVCAKAQIISPKEIFADSQKIKAKNIVIATGSRPIELRDLKFENKKVLSSDDILEIDSIPENLLIIGGGVVGCEFASIFSTFGSKVTIVELMEHILPAEDKETAKKLEILFKKKGIEILTKTKLETIQLDKFDRILVSVGRTPNIEDIGLEKIGIQKEKKGILVNEYLQTNIDNIFAIGDCIGGILLAHVAAYEGILAAENIFREKKSADYHGIPNCIFTNPEIASVGLNEELAKLKNYTFKVLKFNFLSSGMAHILDETNGFIKIIADKKTQEIIGATIIGPKATELISTLTIAVRNKLKISQINDSIIAHPTLSEGIREAARRYYSG